MFPKFYTSKTDLKILDSETEVANGRLVKCYNKSSYRLLCIASRKFDYSISLRNFEDVNIDHEDEEDYYNDSDDDNYGTDVDKDERMDNGSGFLGVASEGTLNKNTTLVVALPTVDQGAVANAVPVAERDGLINPANSAARPGRKILEAEIQHLSDRFGLTINSTANGNTVHAQQERCGTIFYKHSIGYHEMWLNDRCMDLYDPGVSITIINDACKMCIFWPDHNCADPNPTLITFGKHNGRFNADTYSYVCWP
ncbi:hypothetical protein B0J11DRAFT_507021 [Dendryphion nanum]|uniref:Uncharacterized protein n=1 Tax=Dendryphion nanum TaxID=256645 RepID=A0A9P9ILY0_9PLEO|nr:hypothetical protein B0J11DRAFT_507021 [Dendryphion nanum]